MTSLGKEAFEEVYGGGQLTRGMYGDEFHSLSELFGLICGQMVYPKIIHNAGWYNRKAHKLGWGDLGHAHFRRISEEIDQGEFFVVLSEFDSFWEFVEEVGVIGSQCKQEPWFETPGFEYVVERARYIIGRNQLYMIDVRRETTYTIDGIEFTVINRVQAAQIMRHKFYVVQPSAE